MPVAVIVSSGYNDAESLLVTYCVDILGSFAYPQSIRPINPKGLHKEVKST